MYYIYRIEPYKQSKFIATLANVHQSHAIISEKYPSREAILLPIDL